MARFVTLFTFTSTLFVQVIASKKQIEAKSKQCQEAVDMWNSRAELAVRAGQDELAREALKKRKANEEQMKTWSAQLSQQSQAVDQLLGNTREMESKLAEAKSKKETLKARAATAKSTKQIQDMIGGLDTSTSFAAFDKMEEKVTALEAEAESTQTLIGSDSLEGKFKQLEGGNVDDDLAKCVSVLCKIIRTRLHIGVCSRTCMQVQFCKVPHHAACLLCAPSHHHWASCLVRNCLSPEERQAVNVSCILVQDEEDVGVRRKLELELILQFVQRVELATKSQGCN